MDNVYDLFQAGTKLLEEGDYHAAAVPLRRAADLAPDKTSIREALGRALFRTQQYEAAAAEFEAVVEHAPTNDFALFCLGRSLQQLGRRQPAPRADRLPPLSRPLAAPGRVAPSAPRALS
jgi:Flp pilus assembly protein TadD